jgi:hypothetical protein
MTVAYREPQASRLRGRVDLSFRLINRPDARELTVLPNVLVTSIDVTKTRPSECDTAEVELAGDAIPFDLCLIADKSMFISLWLYEEGSECELGGKGHFFGVVDDISRDRYTLRVTLSCRDMTAVPLGAFFEKGLLEKFSILGAPIETIVEAMLRQIPGTWSWTVESYSTASETSPAPLVGPDGMHIIQRGKKRIAVPVIAPTGRRRIATHGRNVPPQAGKSHLSDIVGDEKISVWTAIANVCARAGLVPEVVYKKDGHPAVILYDSAELHSSDVVHPFRRGEQRHRTYIDGDGISNFHEVLELTGGPARPDYVEVGSTDPKTGLRISSRWPEGLESDEKKNTGMFQYVAGISSQEALQRMARAGYESLAHNQHRISFMVKEPWSAGGGPGGAEGNDNLDLGYGAAIEILTPNFEARAAGKTPLEILVGRGVDPAMAKRIIHAQDWVQNLNLLFQVVNVRLKWSSTSFECEINARRFIGRESLPIADRIF